MSIRITIDISREADEQLTELESAVLAALSGKPADWPPVTAQHFDHDNGERTPEGDPVDRPKRTRRTKAEMEAARAAEANLTAAQDEVEANHAEDAPEPTPEEQVISETLTPENVAPSTMKASATLDDAVKLATVLVSEGRVPEIKTFLTEQGVKRVSDLKGEGINAFVARFS